MFDRNCRGGGEGLSCLLEREGDYVTPSSFVKRKDPLVMEFISRFPEAFSLLQESVEAIRNQEVDEETIRFHRRKIGNVNFSGLKNGTQISLEKFFGFAFRTSTEAGENYLEVAPSHPAFEVLDAKNAS